MSLSIDRVASAHFVGILGSGMSALAQFLAWSGKRVSGSDRMLGREESLQDASALRAAGCSLVAQDGNGIAPSTSIVVVSTAIEESNPDIMRAREHGIPLVHRSELLAAIVNTRRTIAVAGTSGKSTVTAMIFEFLTECGTAPSLITGAGLVRLKRQGYIGNAWLGASQLLVIEADESDGTLVRYHPEISVFLNVSVDHKPIPETVKLFETLASQSVHTIVNADDPHLSMPGSSSFGLSSKATVHPTHIDYGPLKSTVSIGTTAYDLPAPGAHNVENLLAAVAVCTHVGCDSEKLRKAVEIFEGIRRRFTIVSQENQIVVIDDYAHNPAKISAAIGAAHGVAERVIAVFQPHGFGPLRFMKQELIDALRKVLREGDTLILLPIYYAGGTVQRDISSRMVADEIGKASFAVFAPETRGEALSLIRQSAQPGTCILSMGARDPSLELFATEIAAILKG